MEVSESNKRELVLPKVACSQSRLPSNASKLFQRSKGCGEQKRNSRPRCVRYQLQRWAKSLRL